MSKVSITNPVGVDLAVADIQNKMFEYLTVTAGWTNYESYPRAYVNPKKGGAIPEVFTGNREYKECLFDDKFNVTSFFIVENSKPYDGDNGNFEASISIIFQCKLNELYPSITHRADEEMHLDLIEAIKRTAYIKQLGGVITSTEDVYSALSIPSDYAARVALDDMSDFHVVKIDLTIKYSYCK